VRFAAALGTVVSLVDGSGLFPANRASSANVARFLVRLYEGSIYRTLVRALPVAGISGSLRDRMVSSPARGHCHAKPGMLSQVSTLSGYCRTHSGRQLAFSILISHHDTTASSLLEDRMLSILVSRDRPSSTLGKP
jgi:D-alanyl-D-alanine carboxypeptidase